MAPSALKLEAKKEVEDAETQSQVSTSYETQSQVSTCDTETSSTVEATQDATRKRGGLVGQRCGTRSSQRNLFYDNVNNAPEHVKKRLNDIDELPQRQNKRGKKGEMINEFCKNESCVALVDHMFYAYFLLCCNQLWIAGIV